MSQLLFLLILTNYTTSFVLVSYFRLYLLLLVLSFILFMGFVTLIGHFVKNIFTYSLRSLPQKPLKAEGHSFYSLSLIFCLFLCFYALGHSQTHTRITPTFFVYVFSLYHPQFSPSTFVSISSSSPSFFSLPLPPTSFSFSLFFSLFFSSSFPVSPPSLLSLTYPPPPLTFLPLFFPPLPPPCLSPLNQHQTSLFFSFLFSFSSFHTS